MNIREAIEQLVAKSKELPAGLDTPVRVTMCNGTDTEITSVIEIDHMAKVAQSDGSVKDVWVIIQGHPHLDENSTVLHGVMQDADEHLQRWAEENPPG